jgi:hypothetical protein
MKRGVKGFSLDVSNNLQCTKEPSEEVDNRPVNSIDE